MSQPDPPPAPVGDYRMCKPNKMWPDEIRYLIRFYVAAKGEKLAPCPVCKSRKRGRWTMLCPFHAHTLGQFVVQKFETTFAPLTLVCSEHPISPIKEIIKVIYDGYEPNPSEE